MRFNLRQVVIIDKVFCVREVEHVIAPWHGLHGLLRQQVVLLHHGPVLVQLFGGASGVEPSRVCLEERRECCFSGLVGLRRALKTDIM